MPLPAFAGVALAHGLSGLEFGVAIPASLGGSVRMNAGAHGGSLADVVESVDVFGLADGVAQRVGADDAGFAYRRSVLPAGAVIVGATVRLVAGDPGEIRPGWTRPASGVGARNRSRSPTAGACSRTPGRPRRPPDRGGGRQGPPLRPGLGLDETRELHRRVGRCDRRRRAVADP